MMFKRIKEFLLWEEDNGGEYTPTPRSPGIEDWAIAIMIWIFAGLTAAFVVLVSAPYILSWFA
jgi:hypothetical protein